MVRMNIQQILIDTEKFHNADDTFHTVSALIAIVLTVTSSSIIVLTCTNKSKIIFIYNRQCIIYR